MGLEQTVTFPSGGVPSWPAVRDLLGRHGFAVQLRMIDGELAFPDEEPPPSWHELRLGTPQGMVTLRREADRVDLVVWGNADAGLRQAWNALTWACAEAGGGEVLAAGRSLPAGEFRGTAELPEGLRKT